MQGFGKEIKKNVTELTRLNVIALSFAGSDTVATCRLCHEYIILKQKDEFHPIKQLVKQIGGKGFRSVTFNTNKAYLKNFQEVHFGLHKKGERK